MVTLNLLTVVFELLPPLIVTVIYLLFMGNRKNKFIEAFIVLMYLKTFTFFLYHLIISTSTVGAGFDPGISMALEGSRLRVRPCEPKGFDDTARSLISGRREVNATQGGSICDAIVTPSPGVLTFPIMQRNCGAGIVVTDDEALRAVGLAYQRLKIVLEPGGAVALAAALFHGDKIEGDDVVAVATGGNVDESVFVQALEILA